MNIARTMLAAIVASLFLISTATPDQTDPKPTETEAHWQTEQSPASHAPLPSSTPEQLKELRAALASSREELQWVQELLQQTGETLYWAKTRHKENAMTLRALEEQLAAVAAIPGAEQEQVAQREADDEGQARLQALERERDQLRRELADRDQRIALMEAELQSARVELQQARVQMAATDQQLASTQSEYEGCQIQKLALDDELTGSRRSETDARQSLLSANAERYRLHTELASCSQDLSQVRTSFAAVETAASQAPATTARSASEPMTAVAVEEAAGDSGGQDLGDGPISLQGVKFPYDSAELTDESRAILDQVAVVLKRQADVVHEVAGHTDSQGNPAYNMWLSQKRAESVRRYLISRGVDAGRLKARGYGGLQPIADNSTWAGLISNRRVELREVH